MLYLNQKGIWRYRFPLWKFGYSHGLNSYQIHTAFLPSSVLRKVFHWKLSATLIPSIIPACRYWYCIWSYSDLWPLMVENSLLYVIADLTSRMRRRCHILFTLIVIISIDLTNVLLAYLSHTSPLSSLAFQSRKAFPVLCFSSSFCAIIFESILNFLLHVLTSNMLL